MMVVDASVAVKWLLEENGSDTAVAAAAEHVLIAPTLLWAEVANALLKKFLRGEINPAAATVASTALSVFVRHWHDLEPLAEAALRLAFELRHPVYDCFYLALAEREELHVLTADLRLVNACKGTRFEPSLLPL